LKALNDSEGNLLDDDKIIATLERLKAEAADIMQKVEESETVMEEINRVSDSYRAMGTACSRIYFALEQLDSVHFLYRFSLKFFLDIFHGILHNNPRLKDVKDSAARLDILMIGKLNHKLLFTFFRFV
jgi:dynein heavy chain 1